MPAALHAHKFLQASATDLRREAVRDTVGTRNILHALFPRECCITHATTAADNHAVLTEAAEADADTRIDE